MAIITPDHPLHADNQTPLAIPESTLNSHIALLGKTGSGKTYAAKGFAEWLLQAGQRLCILDPTGAWHGLRSSANGKKPGFAVTIFGGEHGDLPLEAVHGEAIAEALGTSNTPAILDTSQMKVRDRSRFFTDFADALMRKNKGPLHLFIDEAHVFAPQGKVPDPQSGMMLAAANNLVSGGRSRGLRIVLITQRPAKLHKDSLTQVETLIAMRLVAPQDRGAVEAWIEDNADEKKGREILSSLAALKTGVGWVWAPEQGILEQKTFPRIRTFDSSSAPDDRVGGKAPVLAPIDRDAIAARLKSAGADALANDPAALKKRIAELERAAKVTRPKEAPAPALADLQALYSGAHQEGFDKGLAHAYGSLEHVLNDFRKWSKHDPKDHRKLRGVCARLGLQFDKDTDELVAGAVMKLQPGTVPKLSALPVRLVHPLDETQYYPDPPGLATGPGPFTKPQLRVVEALWFWRSRGVHAPTRAQVGAASGYSCSSGGFGNILSELSAGDFIVYPAAGHVALMLTAVVKVEPDDRSVRQRLERVLTRPMAKVLDKIPLEGSITREHLGEATSYSPTSGGFGNILSSLSSLGVITYPVPGLVELEPWMHPEFSQ